MLEESHEVQGFSQKPMLFLKGKEAYFPEVLRKPICDSLLKTGPGLPTLDSFTGSGDVNRAQTTHKPPRSCGGTCDGESL